MLLTNRRSEALYSCFPIVPKLACQHLSLAFTESRRPITLLGGLTSFGGAGNNYSMHVSPPILSLFLHHQTARFRPADHYASGPHSNGTKAASRPRQKRLDPCKRRRTNTPTRPLSLHETQTRRFCVPGQEPPS